MTIIINNIMKTSIKVISVLIIILLFSIFSTRLFAQGLINNGAKIVLTNGSNIYIEGTTGNYTSQMNGVVTNYSSGGTLKLDGNWINNSTNTGFSNLGSTVILTGSSQQIGGTNPTSFYNLSGSGLGNLPIHADMTINNTINLSSSQIFDINGKTLTLEGGVSGTGKFKGSSTSSMVFNASGNLGTINFDQTNSETNKLSSLSVNNTSASVTVGNSLAITGTLTVLGTLNSTGNVKLISDANNTARIADIGSNGQLTGNFTVERYIPSTARRWRFLTSTVTNATVEDWRGEMYVTGPGTGTSVGTTNSNGFDATASNASSIYYYDESATGNLNYGWYVVPATSTTLTPGKGYRVFVRGDRSDLARLTGVNASQNEVTINVNGTPNAGDISMPVTYTNNSLVNDDGWNMLGNPYPSAFDWRAYWTAGNSGYNGTYYTHIDPTIYVWDATSNSYKSYNAASNTGGITGGVIASGQGFFAKATASSPVLTFKESFKCGTTPIHMFKSSNNDELKIVMKYDSINTDIFIAKYISGSSKNDDLYDIKKMSNPTVNISSYSTDLVMHAVDVRPLATLNDTILLNVTGSNGVYQFIFEDVPVTTSKYYFLIDTYLSNTLPISRNMLYSFTISSSIAASQGTSRFMIITSNSSSLPVSFGMFTALKVDKKVSLYWTTISEINSSHFEVERSTNNIDFYAIAAVKSNSNSSTFKSYQTIDENPDLYSVNYYRIKQIDNDGHFTYTPTRNIYFIDMQTDIKLTVFPNPATNQITLTSSFTGKKCDVIILSEEGKLISNYVGIAINNGDIHIDVSQLHSGIYFVRIKEESGNILMSRFVRE